MNHPRTKDENRKEMLTLEQALVTVNVADDFDRGIVQGVLLDENTARVYMRRVTDRPTRTPTSHAAMQFVAGTPLATHRRT